MYFIKPGLHSLPSNDALTSHHHFSIPSSWTHFCKPLSQSIQCDVTVWADSQDHIDWENWLSLSEQPSIARCSSERGFHELLSHPCWLNCCKSYWVCNPNCCDSMGTVTLPCWADTVLLLMFITSGSYSFSAPSSSMIPQFGRCGAVMKILHLELSTPQSIIISILTSRGSPY